MTSVAVALLLGSGMAMSADRAPPTAADIVYLDYVYARTAWSLTCLGYDSAQAAKVFERTFGRRQRRVDDWAAGQFGVEVLQQEKSRQFGDAFEMVGGCRADGTTGEVIDPRPAFDHHLREIERRIPKQQRSH